MTANNSNQKASIISPVSRYIGVADHAAAHSFYRDILGFNLRDVTDASGNRVAVEAVYGPAKIEFCANDYAPDHLMQKRPLGSAILFFETDDVKAMRDEISQRGGNPTELEKVNWIKMEMFQIVDPDGHTLWFGQSYDQPEKPKGQLKQMLPNLPVRDMPAGIAYYRDVLGFHINYAQDDLGVMDRDDTTLVLIPRKEDQVAAASCYAYVRDADALHAELKSKGANVQGEPISHPWGLRDFYVLDLDGNKLGFGQPFE
jgi:uncharacterized glyoxalase superfamily protein PhnB